MNIRKVQKIHLLDYEFTLPSEIEVDLHDLALRRQYMDQTDLAIYLFRKSLNKYVEEKEIEKMGTNMLDDLVILKYICTGGDEISHYDTIKTTPAPLYKYIKEILATKEWGYINIYNDNINLKLEYSDQACKSTIPSTLFNIMNKSVIKASYEGGWTRGDWRLEIADE